MPILNNIEDLAACIQSSYVDGLPLHCHPQKSGRSALRTISHCEFERLSAREFQDMFRHQHVVVYDQLHKKMSFKAAIYSLGSSMKHKVEIQGKFIWPNTPLTADDNLADQSVPADENKSSTI